MASTDKKEDQGINPGDELNKIEMIANRPTPDPGKEIEAESSDVFTRGRTHVGHGSVLIAAITSCTNTSNPSVMIAAGLLAKKAVERGLRVDPAVKTSLAPGSRVVSDYLHKTGLQKYLDQLGFNLVGYGCTTCIGNSGALHPGLEDAIRDVDVIMMLRLQHERMTAGFIPSLREYSRIWGLSLDKLKHCRSDVLIMHPGPVNRGGELSPEVADGPDTNVSGLPALTASSSFPTASGTSPTT